MGYCTVDGVLIMLDVVDMHEQFDNNSACNLTTGKLHSSQYLYVAMVRSG
jgi:hypothetical protein